MSATERICAMGVWIRAELWLGIGLLGLLAACDGLEGLQAKSDADLCVPDPPAAYCATDQTLFRQPFAETGSEAAEAFLRGSKIFNATWQTASLGAADFDGLGPVFDNSACASCHIHNGRGHPPESSRERADTMVVRLSVPGQGESGTPMPHPAYGYQLNHQAIDGVEVEGRLSVTYETIDGEYADGDYYQLRKPVYAVTELAYGPLGEGTMVSPRVAPPGYGVGLLEAVSDEEILANADPEDANGDGISGRPNMLTDERTGQSRLGRFGWKAAAPSVRHQVAAALSADIGVTSSVFPERNCPQAQATCQASPDGGTPEITEAQLDDLTRYMQLINVSARTSSHPAVKRGSAIFHKIGCAGCHTPRLTTAQTAALPVLAGREIYPYTDLLLHDMGEGLADNRPEFGADGREWRTAPLWYIGLTDTVSGHSYLLHDGRARNFSEAILWHGGEAQASRDAFANLSRDERDDVLLFLGSL